MRYMNEPGLELQLATGSDPEGLVPAQWEERLRPQASPELRLMAAVMIDAIRDAHPEGVADPFLRQRIADVYIEHTVLDLIRLRTLTAALKGEAPGPEASIRKILADEHGQHVMALARDLIGAHGMLTGGDGSEAFVPGTDTKGLGPEKPAGGLSHAGWYDGYMFSQALTIGGGTGDVQRNIVAERVLGLPHDVNVTAGMTWAQAQRATAAVAGS